ncbi:MAG: FHA domain-containing protein [Planctomycetes bacterium]|nr:FHA domain-containing protein [Planctomycetota bacterium]
MATIHVIQGPDKGRTHSLPARETRVGREAEDLQLNDPTVSREHVRLFPRNGEWIIEDLGSANGTYVNGVRLRRTLPLRQGDQVRMGSTLLVFGGSGPAPVTNGTLDIDEDGNLVDSAIITTVPGNADSVIMPTPEAGDRAIGNLRHLYNLIGTISTIFDAELLANRVLDHVCELFHPDRGFVVLIDPAGRLAPVAVRYNDGEKTDGAVPLSRTIVNHVVEHQVGVLCSNAMGDKRFTKGHSVHDFGIQSVLCVPIVGRERILGVIHVDSAVSNLTYSTEQLRLLTAIGYQTGLALENVQLYEASVKSERLAAVGEAVASLSHSIKNILQALQAGADVVDMAVGGGKLDQAREAWPIVTRNLDRINSLIVNMLAFSKQRQPLLQSIAINHVVTECVDLLTARADERGVALLTDLGDVPAIPADVEGLHQAVLNLMTNALDVVADTTGAVTIRTSFDTMDRVARIAVADNGLGMDAGTRARIFEPFFSTKGQKGTGLGLAVTRKVVEEHGGRIEVDAAPGRGSIFTIVLPSTPPESATPQDTQGPARPRRFRTRR